jgi:hypothetical protein
LPYVKVRGLDLSKAAAKMQGRRFLMRFNGHADSMMARSSFGCGVRPKERKPIPGGDHKPLRHGVTV